MEAMDLDRLASYVKTRRLELDLARKRAADIAGMSKDTWQRIEEGKPVRSMSYAKVDHALQWATGSCEGIAQGREPLPSRPADSTPDAAISELPREDRDEQARETIQLATIATTSGLTADEIRALSDRAVKDLRERGLI